MPETMSPWTSERMSASVYQMFQTPHVTGPAGAAAPVRREPYQAMLRDLGEALADLSRRAMEEAEVAGEILPLASPAAFELPQVEAGDRGPNGGLHTNLNAGLNGGLDGGLRGLPEVESAVAAAVAGARSEVLVVFPGGVQQGDAAQPGPLGGLPRGLREALRRGVAMRALYQHTAQFDEQTKQDVRSVAACGAQVRTLDELFGCTVVVDREVAFIPANEEAASAARITDPATVRFLAELFENAWTRAEEFPFVPRRAADAAPRVIPAIRSAIQRLLVEGLSDRAIARRLAISERSLQAHICRIKQDLGAQNRIQLGYLLGRAGEAA